MERKMVDVTLSDEEVEISIRQDGRVVWINGEMGCIVRVCGIKKLTINNAMLSVNIDSEKSDDVEKHAPFVKDCFGKYDCEDEGCKVCGDTCGCMTETEKIYKS